MSATLKLNVSWPRRCLVAPTLPTVYACGRMVRCVPLCSLAPNIPSHTFPCDPQEFKFRDTHQKLRRQVPPFMDVKGYMSLTTHLSGRPLPRLCVRCRWQSPRRTQQWERVHSQLDRKSREQKGSKLCTPAWRYLTASSLAISSPSFHTGPHRPLRSTRHRFTQPKDPTRCAQLFPSRKT